MSAAVAIVRADQEGEHLRFWGGGILTMKATADETGGAFMLFEDFMSRGKATPLHVHANEDEALYVLEGELLVHIDGTDHPIGPRAIAFAPRGVPHAFLVTSPTARVLCLQAPGSAEAFYRGASVPAGENTDPPGRSTSSACERRQSAVAACRSSGHHHSRHPMALGRMLQEAAASSPAQTVALVADLRGSGSERPDLTWLDCTRLGLGAGRQRRSFTRGGGRGVRGRSWPAPTSATGKPRARRRTRVAVGARAPGTVATTP